MSVQALDSMLRVGALSEDGSNPFLDIVGEDGLAMLEGESPLPLLLLVNTRANVSLSCLSTFGTWPTNRVRCAHAELQHHPSEEVYQKAVAILETYFQEDDEAAQAQAEQQMGERDSSLLTI